MISFQRMSLLRRLAIWLIPSEKRKYDAELKEAIRYLCQHPEVPCIVETTFIPDGFGGTPPQKEK
jgi:hypothetical protein